ncbi:hydantoinase/oxoprolinase family protein [soil metagenome]
MAVDIGGTFTDLVAIDEQGNHLETKTPTTPWDFSVGVLDSIASIAIDPSAIDDFVHGTTVVINTITERTGEKTALITTAGFRDVLAIGRGNRPDMYNLKFRKPEPFVPRSLRFEVAERVGSDGNVVRPLDLPSLDPIATACRDNAVGAIAVCFLHSYAYPVHEQQAGQYLSGLLPDVSITLSSTITREWREYERTSTAVLNAYVQPRIRTYLELLESKLIEAGTNARRFVMTSNGGTSTFDLARQQPIQLVESGPSGGVLGAQMLGSMISEPNMITLDIGGTTAKCSIIVNGQIAIADDYRLEWTPLSPGYPAKIPVIDIVEIGAGGGSIVWFDAAGALRIGPSSAGASPGPACYDMGGTEPTITDAMVLAGYIAEGPIPGSTISIDRKLALAAFHPIAERLSVDIDAAVAGTLDLFRAITVDALNLVSVRRGHDPRDFTLVAFGGGGPLHAALLGSELGVKRVVIPPLPSTFSAWGMLHANPRVDRTRTSVSRLEETHHTERERTFADLEADARTMLLDQGFDLDQLQTTDRAIDMRYAGQEHTVRCSYDRSHADDKALACHFNTEHKKMYTFALEDTPIELVNFRVTATAKLTSQDVVRRVEPGLTPDDSRRTRAVLFGGGTGRVSSPKFQRNALPPHFECDGPAIIEELATSSVVPPGSSLHVDSMGNLVIVTGASAQALPEDESSSTRVRVH